MYRDIMNIYVYYTVDSIIYMDGSPAIYTI